MKHYLLYVRIFCISLLLFGSCKKAINVNDITADNYKDLLIRSGEHSLDKYEYNSGVNYVADYLIMDSRAKEIISINYPWKFTNEVTPIKNRVVSYYNQITPEWYSVTYFSPETNLIGSATFMGMPINKYRSDLDALLKKKGFIYKETDLKSGSDILIKEVEDQVFVVVEIKEFSSSLRNGETINLPSGYMSFGIYTAK